jgi:Cu(I)/Ag(I) efflux system membrane protein CusA/SilA
MIRRLVAWCTRHPVAVLTATIAAAVAGVAAQRQLPRDAIPDLSDPQIVLVADWMGHPATEVAAHVTQTLTGSLDGIPGAVAVRGSSMAGMAYVAVVFEASADLARGRRAIRDRIAKIRGHLPPTVRVEVGPEASSTGWVFQYALVDPTQRWTTRALRAVQEQMLRPALAAVPGVAEVATVGGGAEQLVVAVKLEQLRARGLAFSDAVAAVRQNVAGGEMTLKHLDTVPLRGGPPAPSPVKLGDVAHFEVTEDMPTGIADVDGTLAAVGGIVIARRGADPETVIAGVKRALEKLRPRLKAGMEVRVVYDRTELAGRAAGTLLRALGEEIAVVVLVILIFLLHARSAVVPLTTLPIALLLTFTGMWMLGVPATIMSLGGIGIALGMAVDADVVALEACHRRLERIPPGPSAFERRQALLDAAGSFAPAIVTSLLIAAVSFLPVFAFTGETGRLLRPIAITKTLVIAASALIALTLAPALREQLLRGRIVPELDNPVTGRLIHIYRPLVLFALRWPLSTLVIAALAIVSCLPIAARLGGEFLPRIDEGDLLYMPTTAPGAPAGPAGVQLAKQDRALAQFDEVASVFGKVGRADTATDPAPFSMAETTIRLRPRSEWAAAPRDRWYSGWAPAPLRRLFGLVWPETQPPTTAALIERLDRAASLPGWTGAWTAPARARMDMMATGVSTPVGIRIVAGDPARLDRLGGELRALTARLPGTRSAVFESQGGQPWPRYELDPAALAAHRVPPGLAQMTAELLLAGGQLGSFAFEDKHYRVRVVAVEGDAPAAHGVDLDRLGDVTVRPSGPTGQPVPLGLLGRATVVSEPDLIRSERGALVGYVQVDLDGTVDIARYVAQARAVVARALRLGPGETIEWTGQYQLLAAGEQRLRWIVPLAALAMLGLLLLLFRSLTESLLVLASVPFALVGSVWTLYLLGYPLSAPVWVGLLSTAGLAMQTGVVMVVYIDDAFHRRVRAGRLDCREDIVAAHAEGTIARLRPKLMTITTMAAGLLPLLWADGAGAEIMRRVAAPMIGGLLTSAFLTLEVIPVLYTIWRSRQLARAHRLGVGIEVVVGRAPSWARRL